MAKLYPFSNRTAERGSAPLMQMGIRFVRAARIVRAATHCVLPGVRHAGAAGIEEQTL